MPPHLDSIDAVQSAFAAQGYVADRDLATSVFLARALERPLLLEGEAGVGKTEVARRWPQRSTRDLIRLQCYEGIDVATAVYEWDYPAADARDPPARGPGRARARRGARRVQRALPARRPLLQALRATRAGAVLLIDEVDRADEEFEAFLLELLSRLPGHHPRDRHHPGGGRRRSSSSPPTARARCTTRSSVAASTTGSTTRALRRELADRARPRARRGRAPRRRGRRVRPAPARRRPLQAARRRRDARLGRRPRGPGPAAARRTAHRPDARRAAQVPGGHRRAARRERRHPARGIPRRRRHPQAS